MECISIDDLKFNIALKVLIAMQNNSELTKVLFKLDTHRDLDKLICELSFEIAEKFINEAQKRGLKNVIRIY